MGQRTYRLTVQGELGAHMASAFPGMTVTAVGGMTILDGEVRDQAELQGMLQRVSDLGLTLVEAKALGSQPAGRSGHDPDPADAAERTSPGSLRNGHERS